MADIVGIRFRKAGRVYYFDPSGIELKVNDYAIVETTRGTEMGQVVIAPKQIVAEEIEEPLKPVVRKAEPQDIEKSKEFQAKERDALVECGKFIEKLQLPMKLLAAEYNFDGSRLTFYFSAEERVDFRKLVRELTSFFHVRVELRQVGSRDEARLVGDVGRCGRPLCCLSFLNDFDPVSIKMAKDQNLPLNPMRISGVCGRLMCCLGYECEQYRVAKEKLPRQGQKVTIPVGPGTVVDVNILKETVMVELETGVRVEVPVKDLQLESGPAPQPERRNAGPVVGGTHPSGSVAEERKAPPHGGFAQPPLAGVAQPDSEAGQSQQERSPANTPRPPVEVVPPPKEEEEQEDDEPT